MFKLSVKVEYGILAVLALSLHEDRAVAPLSAGSIAEKENLSIRFLEQAMNALKERGVIESVRGPHGGYRLLKSPKEITLSDVILAFEGQKTKRVSAEFSAMFPSKPKILNEIVEGIDRALENHLHAIDFDTLTRRTRELTEKEALMFHI
jgi:Rrf2 family protein